MAGGGMVDGAGKAVCGVGGRDHRVFSAADGVVARGKEMAAERFWTVAAVAAATADGGGCTY